MDTVLPSGSSINGDGMEEQFQWLFVKNPLPMWIHDLGSLKFLAVNEAAVKQFGYQPAEFLHLRLMDIQVGRQVGGDSASVQMQIKSKDGSIVDVEAVEHNVIFNGHQAVLLTTKEVVLSKRAAWQGDQSAAQLSSLVATAMDGVVIVDQDQKIILFNNAAEAIFGWPAPRILGQHLDILVPARFHSPHHGFVKAFGDKRVTKRRMGNIHAVEIMGLRADGTEFPAEISISRFESEGRIFYTAIIRDVTERKQTEAALTESEKRYRALAEGAHDMIFIINRQGLIEYANGYAAAQLNLTPAELTGRKASEFFPTYVVEGRLPNMAHVLETGESLYVETENPFPGRSSWLGTRLVPMQDENGDVYAVLGVARDISDRKKAELILQRHDAVLEVVSFAAERFLKTSDWKHNIHEILAYLGQVTGTSRVYIFENSMAADGRVLAHYRYEWVAPGITPQIDNPDLQKVPYQESGLGRWEDLLGSNQPLSGNVKDFPESEQRILIPQNILSLVVVPIFVGGTFWGHMGYDECLSEREWTGLEIEALRTAANILGAAIQNKYAKEALRTSEAEFRSLFENALEGIYRTTPDGRILAANPALVEMFGYGSIHEMKDIDIARGIFVHPEDRDKMSRLVDANGEVHNVELVLKRKNGEHLIALDSSRAIRDANGKVLYYEGTIIDITERKRIEGQLQLKIEQLSSLHAIDLAISSNTDLRITLGIVSGHMIRQLNVDALNVLLLNPHSLMLTYTFGQGFRSLQQSRVSLRLGEGQAGRAALERRTIFIADLPANLADFSNPRLLEGEDFKSYVCVPLIAKGEVKGVLGLFKRTQLEPDDAWFDFLQVLAGQTAIAIDNNALFNDLQRSNLELTLAYDATIEGWSRALELRDSDTEGHTWRVTQMVIGLAQSLGLSDSEIMQIRRGALLHDIGKMGVPDDILNKPGPLTADEWEVMRRHTQYAYEMLKPIEYLHAALDIPYCHHEKWDGTGYPRGLAGEDIPLAARIFAVLDVYDALTSDRPYRKAWTKEDALRYIRDEAGKRFDPKVVDKFLSIISELDGS